MFNLIAVTSAIFFGVLADRAGALRFCYAGLACLIAGSVVGAASASPTTLLASRVIEGLGFLAEIVAAPGVDRRSDGTQAT
jgi:MFS family permease